MPYGQPPRPRRNSRLLIIIVVLVVVLLVVGAIAFVFLVPAAPPIQVGQISIYAPDLVCGLAATPPYYYPGFNNSTGANMSFEFYVPNFNATNCTVRSLTTNTSGFMVTYAQVPLPILAHGNATMNVSIGLPSSSFSGNLNLVFR